MMAGLLKSDEQSAAETAGDQELALSLGMTLLHHPLSYHPLSHDILS